MSGISSIWAAAGFILAIVVINFLHDNNVRRVNAVIRKRQKDRDEKEEADRVKREAEKARQTHWRLIHRQEAEELRLRQAVVRNNRAFYVTRPLVDKPTFEIKINSTHVVNCPLCREDVSGEDFSCPSCQTAAHQECLDEMSSGKCPTWGCAQSHKMLA